MTLEDMNSLRPMLDTLDESDLASRKVLNEIFLRNVNSQHKLAQELEHSRSELEHGQNGNFAAYRICKSGNPSAADGCGAAESL